MPTRKSTKSRSSKKGGAKKGKDKPLVLPGDPPIIVGGGGSAFVWIRKDLDPQLVDGTAIPASAPQPAHPDQYYCFKCSGINLSKIIVDEGNGGGAGPSHGANARKNVTQFDT
jgi:hypothetical protein